MQRKFRGWSVIAEYDVTVLVTATPPRHASSKQVITAVTGRVDIPEVSDLEPAVTLSRHDGRQVRRIFTSPDGDAYEISGRVSPGVFTDGPEGLQFLRDFRLAVSQRLRSLSPSGVRAQFHPGAKIVTPEDFARVDPWASGATALQMGVVEQARARVEKHLSEYVVMAGVLFRRAMEPFLVLSCGEYCQRFKLSVETDVRVAIAVGGEFAPIACFGLHETKAARNYAASLLAGPRPRVKGDGIRISDVDTSRLYIDPAVMTFRAAAVRMFRGYLELAERSGDVESALTELPIAEIIAFRQLADAISRSWMDVEAIDTAVAACLQYEESGGRKVFSSHVRVREMLETWNDRPIGIGLRRSSGPAMLA
ncbi:hypothetical protein GOB57_21075 [Sinorhizobium meliloti]|nr:hypothetical protein [Sinorhizobium meliloti]